MDELLASALERYLRERPAIVIELPGKGSHPWYAHIVPRIGEDVVVDGEEYRVVGVKHVQEWTRNDALEKDEAVMYIVVMAVPGSMV